MNAIARKSYLEFRRDIPAQFRITKGSEKGSKVAEFRETVGKEIVRFRAEHMTTTGDASHRDERWRSWLRTVSFDEASWKILEKINDDTVSGLKEKQTNIEFYIAIYYRLHAVLDDMSFADAIDGLVFKSPLRRQGIYIFVRDTRPTAPFIHPPYVTEDYVRQRLENDPTDGVWLNPHNHHSIKFSGRQKERAHLDAFMARKETFLICPVIAPSGAGKTRLISEWMKQYVPSVSATEWDAGFVISRDSTPWTKQEWTVSRDTLIIIDYTFAYADVVKEIAQRARTDGSGRKIRLIVIDHVFPNDLFGDTFWQGLYQTRSIMEGTHHELYGTLEIRPEGNQSELLRDVAAAVASVGGKAFDRDHPTIKSAIEALHRMGVPSDEGGAYSDPDAVRHPLFAALLGHAIRFGRDFTHWNRRGLIDYYFTNEDRLPWEIWNKANKRKGWGLTVGALVSAATLCKGLPLSRVRRRLPGDPKAIIQYANRIVSSNSLENLKPFQPDLLGEGFTLKFLAEIENWEAEEEKRGAWELLLSMLHVSEDENEKLEAARNFLETVTRLVRNLLNDDQQIESVTEAWSVLDGFLLPERFPAGSLLRQTISLIRADAVRQCRGVRQNDRAAQFSKNVDIGDMQVASSGPLSVLVATAFMHLFDWKSLRGKADSDDVKSMVLIGRNLQEWLGDRWSALMLAVSEDCLEVVKAFLEELEEDNNACQSQGWTMLTLAACKGHCRMVEWLITRGADVNLPRIEDNWTALIAACAYGHTETATLLLEKNAAINQPGSDGWTALMASCSDGHTQIASLLLEKGAAVNLSKTDNACTALMAACEHGHTQTAALLLENEATVNQAASNGWTALMLACDGGHTETAALLLEKGAGVNQAAPDGWTALMAACDGGHAETAALLLEKEAAVNQADSNGWTALIVACERGHTETATVLLEKGADVERRKDGGWSALMFASGHGHAETAASLLRHRAETQLTASNNNGLTPLMTASALGRLNVVNQILSFNGISLLQTDVRGRTALDHAQENGDPEIIRVLQEATSLALSIQRVIKSKQSL